MPLGYEQHAMLLHKKLQHQRATPICAAKCAGEQANKHPCTPYKLLPTHSASASPHDAHTHTSDGAIHPDTTLSIYNSTYTQQSRTQVPRSKQPLSTHRQQRATAHSDHELYALALEGVQAGKEGGGHVGRQTGINLLPA